MRNNKIQLCLLFASLVLLAFLTSPVLPAAGQLSSATAYKNYLPMLIGPDLPRWVGPEGGSVVSMAVDPKNGNIVYAGSYGGGVYKSTDAGEHWLPASNGITNLLIHNLVVDPTNSNRIYAGTYRSGVFRSDDGGNTWIHASNGMKGMPIVYGLAVNDGYPNMIYAGTRDGGIDSSCSCPPWRGVLYKSWDYGNNWTPVLYDIGGSGMQDWVYAVAVDPVNYNNILAATHEHGIYWTDQYGGSLSEWHPTSGINDLSTRAIVFDPRGNNPLTGTFDRDALYRSTDEGQHWKLSNSGLDQVRIFPNGLSASKSSPGVVYAASMSDPGVGVRGVFRSENSGSSWSFKGLSGKNLYTVRVSSTNSSVVYAGAMNEGLFKSTDSGGSWKLSMTGIANTNVTGIVRPYQNMIMVSTYGNGVFFSFDDRVTWYSMNSGLSDLNVTGLFIEPGYPYVVYALTSKAGLKKIDLRTTISWGTSGREVEGLSAMQWDNAQEFPAVDRPVDLPAGKDNPFKIVEPAEELLSLEKGTEAQSAGPLAPLPTTAPLLSMTSAPTDSLVMYVGTSGSGVFTTLNGGASWSHSVSGINGLLVRDLAVDQLSPQVAYAVTSTNGVVFATTDAGATWSSDILPALPLKDFAVYAIATDKDAYGRNIIYVGTSQGLWVLPSGAPQWYELGLFDYAVTAVAPNPVQPGALFAGTSFGAFYSSDWMTLKWTPVSSLTFGHVIQRIAFDPDMKHVYFGANSHGMFILPWGQ